MLDQLSSDQRQAMAFRAKAVLRAQLAGVIGILPAEAIEQRSRRLIENLAATALWKASQTILLMAPSSGPWNAIVLRLAELALHQSKLVLAPRVCPETMQLVLVRVDRPNLAAGAGFFPCLAPETALLTPPDAIDLVVAVAIAVDPSGHVVDDGSGALDDALRLLPTASSLAIAFDFQVIPESPVTAGDPSVQMIATDIRVFEAGAAVADHAAQRQRRFPLARPVKEDRRDDRSDADCGPSDSGGSRSRICVCMDPSPQAGPSAEGGSRTASS